MDLIEKLLHSANQTIAFFNNQFQQDGSYDNKAADLACYYKSPMLFILAGQSNHAKTMLTFIQNHFLQANGDLKTTNEMKSIKPEYKLFWSYMNGWIIRAASRMDMQKLTDAAYTYFKSYYIDGVGFINHDINSTPVSTDVLTGAHHGLIHLEMGNHDLAIAAGEYLCEAIRYQPDIQNGFYLFFDAEGKPIKEFTESLAPFYYLNRQEPNQLYFMLGYPAAYLSILYQHTQEARFLQAAKYYIDYALSCHQSVYESLASHKIAWASSYLYAITGEEKYFHTIEKITNFFMQQQLPNGLWYEDANAAYDQSAEIACWFLEIAQNLREANRKNALNTIMAESEL